MLRLLKKQLRDNLPHFWRQERGLTRPVLENILVGTLMGTLVAIFLRTYLDRLQALNLDWTLLFIIFGLLLGLFSGFEREKKEQLENIGKKLSKEIKNSEDQLIQTEIRFENLIECANDVIFTLDTENRFVEINTKFEEVFGYERRNWEGRSFYDLIVSNQKDDAIKFYWETLKGGRPRFELDAIREDGQVISLAMASAPINDSEGEVVGAMIIARDISESKKIEELQNKFISHVSHELRTPLTAMREFVSLLLDGIPGIINGEQKDYLGRIEFNIDRLTRIIENLLFLSKADEERITPDKRFIDIKDLILQVKEDFKVAAGRKSLQLGVSIPENLPHVYADPDKIIQVITNLVGNSLKFTPPGGMIKIGAQGKKDELEIWVQDTGVGIAPEDQEKIFDRFQQIRQGHKFGRKGTGLGLAISREIVRLHRGEIRVESKLGAGSRFIFTMPWALAPKILLVDDDPDLVEMYKDFLEPQQCRIITAVNGEEAVQKAGEEIPDLMILDIVMPKMNGYEVIGRLKENKLTCHIPIIILTGYGLDRQRLDDLSSRAVPALHKPVSMKEFLNAVSKVLGTKSKTPAE